MAMAFCLCRIQNMKLVEYATLTVFGPVVLFSLVNSAVSLLKGSKILPEKFETDVLSGLPL